MFLSTFGLGEWSVANLASGHENTSYGMSPSSSTILEQKRNRPNGNRSLRSQVSKEVLKTFLNSIPKLPSHYCRKNNKKIYFEPLYAISISDVYKEYTRVCAENPNGPVQPVSKSYFYNHLDEGNYSFQPWKKDRCDKCIMFEEGHLAETAYQNHLEKKTEHDWN